MINFAIRLVRRGLISPAQFMEALERELDSRKRLGQIALEAKKLTVAQVFKILERQAEVQSPFGRIAVELGYLTEKDLAMLLFIQSEETQTLAEILSNMAVIEQSTLDAELAQFYAESVENRETSVIKHVVT